MAVRANPGLGLLLRQRGRDQGERRQEGQGCRRAAPRGASVEVTPKMIALLAPPNL